MFLNTSYKRKMKQYKTSYSMMIFPSGPICNMGCDYCYYKEKKSLYKKEKNFMMSEELLEKFTKQYIESQSGNTVIFVWQGGEPLLRGLDFFEKAIMYQKKYLPENYNCMNLIQTNGTLITSEWCKFFKENNFLVGVSIDGPERFHNCYRKYKDAEFTFKDVIRGLELLQKNRIEYNVICTVNNVNVKYPLDVYNFF